MSDLDEDEMPEDVESRLREEVLDVVRPRPEDDLPEDMLDAMRDAEYEALAARSDEEWWEDEFSVRNYADELNRALDDLERAGCNRARLLSDLRELEGFSPGYRLFRRRELSKLIGDLNDVALKVEHLEYSNLANVLPRERVTSEQMRQFATALDKIRERLSKSPEFWIKKVTDDLNRWVDRTVRKRGRVGKKRQHEALAQLTSAMLQRRRTAAGQRVATSRLKPKQKANSQKETPAKAPRAPGRYRKSVWEVGPHKRKKEKPAIY